MAEIMDPHALMTMIEEIMAAPLPSVKVVTERTTGTQTMTLTMIPALAQDDLPTHIANTSLGRENVSSVQPSKNELPGNKTSLAVFSIKLESSKFFTSTIPA